MPPAHALSLVYIAYIIYLYYFRFRYLMMRLSVNDKVEMNDKSQKKELRNEKTRYKHEITFLIIAHFD